MSAASSVPAARHRDVRLDFFRGIGMFIIFMAHVPTNPWSDWIPARFGFSDATEIFVFCSGMASAIAFAKVFDTRGFWIGTARIAHRCWQVYWTHITLFVAAVALLASADRLFGTGETFLGSLNLLHFLKEETAAGFVGLLTLTYVPNLFDILPMYLVILAMVPIIMFLSRFGAWAPITFSAVVWLVGTTGHFQLPAEPWSDRPWFFHPLGWQLVFFTGFAFIRGWLPTPPIDRRLVAIAIAVVVVSALLVSPGLGSFFGVPNASTFIPFPLVSKNTFGVLRYIHFLALAYLAYAAAGPQGRRLASGPFVDLCRRVGQQALAAFVTGVLLALVGGIVFHFHGRGALVVAIVNLVGFVLLVLSVYLVAWFKGMPWKTHVTRAAVRLDKPEHVLVD